LLGDVECRYGVGHPIALEIRAALPKLPHPASGTSMANPSRRKPNTASRFKRLITAIG
jgi:hypothetical protein